MKETFYFSHDYNARNDIKVKKLLSKHGLLGYGIFWALIEELYNNDNALPTDYDTIAFDLRTDNKVLVSIINDFDLFIINDETFGSLSVQERLDKRNLLSMKARSSANKRWKNANALQSTYEPITIKESKVKSSKVKGSKKMQVGETASDNAINPDIVDSADSGRLKAVNLKTGTRTLLTDKVAIIGRNDLEKGGLGQKNGHSAIILPFNSPEFIRLWEVLLGEKKWKKKSQAALQASLNKLLQYGEQGAIQSMTDAIGGEYQGFHPPKENFNNNQSKLIKNKNAFEEAKLKLKNDVDNASL